MKGQESTVMMYLVWAVFFLAVAGALYYVYNNNIKTSTPSPYPQMLDTIRSAIESSKAGIGGKVCIRINISNPLGITKKMIESQLQYNGDVTFVCRGGCSATSDQLMIEGGNGRFCAEKNSEGLFIVWSR